MVCSASDCRSAEENSDRTPPDPVTTTCIRNTVEAIIPRLKDLHQTLLEPPQVFKSFPGPNLKLMLILSKT